MSVRGAACLEVAGSTGTLRRPACYSDGMNELPHPVHEPPGGRDPLRGALLLYLLAMIAALGVHPVIKLSGSLTSTYDLNTFLIPIAAMIPFFVAVGFAFALPLLWFRTTIARYGMGVLVPIPLWILFALGAWLSFDEMDSEVWSQITVCLVLSLAGGCVPISLVMGLGRWRLGIGSTAPVPIGTKDLLGLITFVALALAYLRQSRLFDEPDLPIGILILSISFYGLVGAVVFASLLLAMKITLDNDNRPFRPMNLVGVALTVLLTMGVWSILLMAGDGIFTASLEPFLLLLMYSAVSWLVAAGSALAIGWWLRRHGFRLSTAAIDR